MSILPDEFALTDIIYPSKLDEGRPLFSLFSHSIT